MGHKHTPVESQQSANKDNPNKTEALLTGGKAIVNEKEETVITDVETIADPQNPEKTITTITNSDVEKFKVSVEGKEFRGETTVNKGTELKYALMDMVKGGPAYGSFKYRDEQDNPISISYEVDRDLNLKSLRRGED